MFDADRPITKSEQDRLGRTTFAKYLARCILDHTSPESFVIGLYGGWGVGKTSVINLMIEELNFASSNMFDDERPIILNFSPWSYSGQNQLIYNFFRRLSSEIRSAEYFKPSEKIIYLLELYVSFFTNKPVPAILRPKHSWWEKMSKRKIIHGQAFGWESGHDLTQVKRYLNELLSKQKHKIIIIIDNIARLDQKEIKQIFQIVKSIGNFLNTTYVLSMDKDYVIKVLNQTGDNNGDYLEKVVQLPFQIPAITEYDIESIFQDRLKTILKLVPEGAWNKTYWADLYYPTIKYFFKNVRDITRYINTLNFSYVYVRDVVNPVDFFAITALEVFSPKVYFGIRDNNDLFTDLMDEIELDEKEIAEDKARCEEILNRTEKISYEKLLHFLMQLFPRLRLLYPNGTVVFHSEAIARKNLRICSPDLFDVYFRLSMPAGTIPESEMNTILSMIKDEEGFNLALLRLNKDEKITKFLDVLENKGLEKIPTQYIGNLISALMDAADLFPEGEATLVSFDTPMRIHRIFHQVLRRIDSGDKRFELFREAIKKSIHSIYIIVHELTNQGLEHIETEDTYVPLEHRDFTPDQLQTLKKLATGKIIHWAEIGRLAEHPKLIPILYAWKAWGDEDECRGYVKRLIHEERGLLAFLCCVLKEPIDQAELKVEKNTDHEKYIRMIEDFVPVTYVEPYAKKWFEDINFEQLREREQLALLIFLDLVHADTVKVIPKTTY